MAILSSVLAAAAVDAPMLDLAFELRGDILPQAYPFALEAALCQALPWFGDEPLAGVHPIRAPATDYGIVLSRRARLVLRLPEARAEAATALCGRSLSIGAATLAIGPASLRPLAPFATLHAWNVASSAADAQGFIDDVAMQLEALAVRAQLICGRPEALAYGVRRVAGYGLALHGLSPADSLRLQQHGLGAARRLGCGIFLHHKIIEGAGVDPD